MLRVMVVLGLAGLVSLPCLAQGDATLSEKRPATQTGERAGKTFYRLSFVVQEVEGQRVINSRSYSTIVRDTQQSPTSIRAVEKIPYSSASGANTEWQQLDVGVRIDCRELEFSGNQIAMRVNAEISSLVEGQGGLGQISSHPIIRSNQWESKVELPLKQPTVLFSSHDPASKRTMQLELTVTPIRQ